MPTDIYCTTVLAREQSRATPCINMHGKPYARRKRMIDEYYTWEFYGYYSDELKPHSHKPIVAFCNSCGTYMDTTKHDYHELCKSCAQKKRFEDPNEREKTSKANKKRYENPLERKKLSEAQIKRFEDPLERSKLSKAQKKRWSNPLEHEKASESHKTQWENIDIREKTSKANKKRWASQKEREKQSARMSGENHYNWQGGISFGKYCPKFDDEKKQYIRDKYNNCDYISGIHKDVCNRGRNLDVHHVDYNKLQGCDDHEWRLIPLSQINHMRTNHNRMFWNRLFTYALQYDETYYENELRNIFII